MDRARVNSRVHDHVDGRVGLLGMFVAVFPTRTRQCTQPIHSRVHGLYTAVYLVMYTWTRPVNGDGHGPCSQPCIHDRVDGFVLGRVHVRVHGLWNLQFSYKLL